MDIAIWNLFHDGSIDAVRGDLPGDLELDVSIEYLRELIEPAGSGFRIRLRQCDLLELENWADDSVTSDPEVITAAGPEILSGSESGDHVVVICNGYELRLRYADLDVALDTGEPITVAEVDALAERYWEEWEKRGKARRGV
jgi:hypothetical protein